MGSEGELRAALRRFRRNGRGGVPRPQPESEWGWAVEDRLARLEDQQRWLMRLMAGTLVVALVQVVLRAMGVM